MNKIKIYKAFPAYKNYLNTFYQKNETLKKLSFETQKRALIEDSFPWIFSLSTNVSDDSILVFETVHNCEWLQKAWNNCRKKYTTWQIEIILDQIKKIQPNICFLYPPELFNYDIIRQIRSTIHHESIIAGYDGMNRKCGELYDGYDLIVTCSDFISDYYKKKGLLTYPYEFGFDEKILKKIDINKKLIFNVGFSGSIYEKLHNKRFNLLKYLTKKSKIAIRSEFGFDKNYKLISKGQLKRLIKERNISNYLARWRMAKMNMGPVYGIDMFQFMKDSKISINIHGDNIDFAANARLFEITGIGSCMLTDWKKNIFDIFIPEKEIVTYQSKEEAYDKIKFLLKHENIRKKIALAGQKRTLDCYSYKNRLSNFVTFIKKIYYT